MPPLAAADVTVTVAERWYAGTKLCTRGSLSFGDGAKTYPAGGVPLPAASQFGFVRAIDDLIITGVNGLASDYQVRYDRANHKLQLFEEESVAAGGPLPEADGAEAPAARTYFFEAIGE